MGLARLFRTLTGSNRVDDFTTVNGSHLCTAVTMEDEVHTNLIAARREDGKWNLSIHGISRAYPQDVYSGLNQNQVIDAMESFEKAHQQRRTLPLFHGVDAFKRAVGQSYTPSDLKDLPPVDVINRLRDRTGQPAFATPKGPF